MSSGYVRRGGRCGEAIAAPHEGGSKKMKPTRKVTRRSFMTTVVGGAAAGAAVLGVGASAASAQTGQTNSDPSDRPGYGCPR